MDFNSRKVPIVFRDYSWQGNVSDRHDARYGDLTSPLFGALAHVLDTNLKIVEQPLREGSKLLPRFSNRNLTRAAGEQRGAKSALNLLDSSRKRRLRRLQERGGGNEAAILRDSNSRENLMCVHLRKRAGLLFLLHLWPAEGGERGARTSPSSARAFRRDALCKKNSRTAFVLPPPIKK